MLEQSILRSLLTKIHPELRVGHFLSQCLFSVQCSVFIQPQDLPASYVASLTSGNEEVVGPGWCGDSDGRQRISHLLSGKGKGLSYCPGHLCEFRELFTDSKAAEREVCNLHLSSIKVKNKI